MADAAFGGAGAGGAGAGGAGAGGAGSGGAGSGGAAMGKDVESAGSVPCLVCAATAGEVLADEAARKEMPWRYCDVCGTMYDESCVRPFCMACWDIATVDEGRRGDWCKHTYRQLMYRLASGHAESAADTDHTSESDRHSRDSHAAYGYKSLGALNAEYCEAMKEVGRELLHWNVQDDEERRQLRADLRTAMKALMKLHKTLATGRDKYETRWDEEEKVRNAGKPSYRIA